MNVKHQAILFAVLALGAASCSDDNPWAGRDGEGGIRLNLTTDGEVKDAVPLLTTRSAAPDVPDASEFSVRLTKKSTSDVSNFETLEQFNQKASFAAGAYTIAAYYGSADVEGFEAPYYYGESDVTVLDGRESEVSVTATLASAMVSVKYTNAFKQYFSDYSAAVHAEGHDYIEFKKDETRPAYINPGETDLIVHVTNQSGKSVDLKPAAFTAEAAHHYHVTFDVNNGNVGQAVLVITFDETLDKEDVEIDLTDELFTSAAPVVTPVGFTNDQLFETIEGSTLPDAIKFNVAAAAGFGTATLTIAGEGFTPAFGNEIDLCNATAEQKSQMEAVGIIAKGFTDNPGKYAMLDITGLAAHLPHGDYTVTLLAQDKYMRVSEPVSVKFTSTAIEFGNISGQALLNSGEANVTFTYNGLDPKDITFEAMDKHGVYKECEVKSVARKKRTRAVETKTYDVVIAIPDTDRDMVPARATVAGKVQEFEISVQAAIYELAADGFSKFAAIKINPADASELATITNTVKVYVDGTQVEESRLSRNAETGVITVTGFTPNTNHEVYTSLYANGGLSGTKATFTTEAGTDVTNGSFTATTETINHSKVDVGGKYSYSVGYQATANIVRSEADGWASINAKTCWFDAPGAKNTWFQVPSTYAEDGKVVIRNVAYDHNGTKPAGMPTGFGQTYWYNTNVPTFTTFAAGELFLGSYAWSGSETRVDGISFNCRPNSVSFDYTYAPTDGGSDKGLVEVAVLDASGNVIASGSEILDARSSTKNTTVLFKGYKFGVKGAKLQIRFRSSNGSAPCHVPSGSELSEGFGPLNFGNKNLGDNNYHAVETGSVLTVDNVKLNY